MTWFRWHEGTCEDGKLRVVARNANVTVATVIGVWAIVLEDASHPDHRGTATRGADFYAAVLDLDVHLLDTIFDHMRGAGLVEEDHHHLIVKNWKNRQFETDTTDATNAQRQARWRERHKQNGSQTPRNGHVTEVKRPDTDTDTDKKKRQPAKKYGFEDGIVRVTQKHLDEMIETYTHLDVRAEIMGASGWLQTKENWWHALKAYLAKKNREMHLASKPRAIDNNNGII